jgi:hypothetical protein
VLEVAGAQALNAKALLAAPAQTFGCGEVQAGCAVQQPLLLEQAVAAQRRQARVGLDVLGAGRADPGDPADDLLVACGLHIGMSLGGTFRPPSQVELARAGSS